MNNKGNLALGQDHPIIKGMDTVSSIDSVRPVASIRNNSEIMENKSKCSIVSYGSSDYHQTEESSFGVHLVQKCNNILINHTKEKKFISSNCIQLIPKSRYTSLNNFNSKLTRIEKDSEEDFQIKEYIIDSIPIEKDQRNTIFLQEQHDKSVIQKKNNDKLMVPNIPFSLCISYLRQERSQICNKLQSVWKGYKTRSILRGSLQGFSLLETKNNDGFLYNSGKIYLSYNIHKILLSIIDLYDLILDEESKIFQGSSTNNNSTSWLDAMYEQVVDFKTKYILEVNNALQGNHGKRWVSDIINAKEANKRDVSMKPREKRGLLPKRFEIKYNEKIHRYKLFYKSSKTIDSTNYIMNQNASEGTGIFGKRSIGENQENGEENLESSNNEILTSIYIPYDLVKSNSLEEISTYLGIKTDQILDMIQNKPVSKELMNINNGIGRTIGIELTPGIGRRMNELVKDKTPSFDKTTPITLKEASNSNIYFTPNSLVHGSCREGSECVEYYTPIQEELGDSVFEQNEYGNDEYTENQGATYRINNQIKPKPYLKRKSKSILPSKGTDIDLDKVTSKIKELYKGKNPIEKKVLRKVTVSGGYELSGSRIPNISSTLNIVSDSPSSRNSSSKVSRIPKYTGSISLNNALKSSNNNKGVYSTPQIIRSRYSNF